MIWITVERRVRRDREPITVERRAAAVGGVVVVMARDMFFDIFRTIDNGPLLEGLES